MRHTFQYLPWLLAGLILGAGQTVGAQTDSCTYNRTVFPAGTEMCQGEARVRCQGGSWGSIGFCDDDSPGPAPIAEGPDVVEQPAEED